MPRKKPLLSIVIPVYNEAANLNWHHQIIAKAIKKLPYSFEIVYVNDGSSDHSLEVLKQITAKDRAARYISFSRNFGKEAATTAGLAKSKGNAAIMLDADGQHPVTLLKDFISKWEGGAQVVIGIREANTNEGPVKHFGSKLFYAVLNSMSGGKTITGSTDFRLLDRRVIDEFNKLSEHNRMTRGLVDWLGFRKEYLYFVAPERHAGRASYNFKKLLRLALHGLVSQTTRPLQLAGVLGGSVMFISALAGVFLAIETYVFHDPLHLAVTGSAIVALFVSFLVGIVLICQWLLALYIESIHAEAQNRPLYVVDEEC